MGSATADEGAGGASMASTSTLEDASLGVLQRVLLTTDATVVVLLEGFFGESIRTEGLEQVCRPASPADTELELAGHETILCRKTLLQGSDTGRNYLYAEAWVVLDRLESDVREGLLTTSKPIGRLLAANRIETFREVLHSGWTPAGPLGRRLGTQGGEVLFRTYRIIVGGRPIMLLTEYFPAQRFPVDGGRRRDRILDGCANPARSAGS
jgi:chorismate-pyruvate lyase